MYIKIVHQGKYEEFGEVPQDMLKKKSLARKHPQRLKLRIIKLLMLLDKEYGKEIKKREKSNNLDFVTASFVGCLVVGLPRSVFVYACLAWFIF